MKNAFIPEGRRGGWCWVSAARWAQAAARGWVNSSTKGLAPLGNQTDSEIKEKCYLSESVGLCETKRDTGR